MKATRSCSRGNSLCRGTAVGTKVGQGKARVIESSSDIRQFQEGEVLVTRHDRPGLGAHHEDRIRHCRPTSGGRTCHAAIVSRELGIPCVIGTGNGDRTHQGRSGDHGLLL